MIRDILLLLLLAFLVFAAWLRGQYAVPLAAIFVADSVAVIWRENRLRNREMFLLQLKSSRRELRRGGTVVIGDLLLSYNSRLTTYNLTVGALLTNIIVPSNYKRVSSLNQPEKLTYSLCSLLSGWWALPFGPIVALSCVFQNVTGGEQLTVKDLIEPPTARKEGV